jgi:hypothetical protein
LNPGDYSLSIWAEGFKTAAVDHISLKKSLNLGDFALEKL